MKKILITPLLLIASLGIASAQDAQYKLVQENWTVNPDGTTDYHYRHEVQILRNRALTAYADKGETFVVYNPEVEELTLNEVYTLRADGSRVDMPQNAFVYQLPSECADCGRYNHLVELAMVHTGMELGCTVVVDYTLRRRYGVLNQTLTLCKADPIARYEVSISLPQDQQLGVQFSNPGLFAISVNEETSSSAYSLVATDLPATFRETQMPEPEALYPTLHFYNGTHRYTPAFDHSTLPEAADWARAMGGGRHTIATAGMIRDYVRDYIHLNDIDPAHLAYTHASAAEVWQSGCGTPVDKAVLLAALLRSAGFEASVMESTPEYVSINLDTLTYALSVLDSKGTTEPYGKAYDAVQKTDTTISLGISDYTMDSIADGYFRYRMPADYLMGYNAANLSLSRTAPLASQPCNLHIQLKIALPKGMKVLTPKQDDKISFEGIGSASCQMRQKGSSLVIDRTLTIEPTTIATSDYARYRQLVALWSALPDIILQSK